MAKRTLKEHKMSKENPADASTDVYEKLHEAVIKNDIHSINKLLQCSEAKKVADLLLKILWSIEKTEDPPHHFGVTILREVIEDWSKNHKSFGKTNDHERLFRSIISLSDSWKSINACGCPAVRAAVTHWNHICLEIFAEKGMDLGACNKKDGENLLHLVGSNQKVSKNKDQVKRLTQILIQNGCDINGVSNENWTPLHNAISNHYKTIVQVFIELGANVNINNGSAWPYTPLILAVVSKSAGLARILIEAGANVNCWSRSGLTPLYFASKIGDVELIDILLKHRAYVNFSENRPKSTALHAAASEGHLSVIQKLINAGAHVNARDQEGRTPLYNASELIRKPSVNHKKLTNHIAVIDLLVKSQADVHVVDKKNDNLLHVAAMSGSHQIVYRLLQYGVKKFQKNLDDMTPLEVALRKRWSEKKKNDDSDCAFDYTSIIEMLIELKNKYFSVKSNVNMSRYFGYLLYLASEAGDNWSVQLLLNHGADVNYKQPISGTTALHAAIEKEQIIVISRLISGKAEINVKDVNGKTPLHMATCCSLHHRIRMIPMLLKAGARIDLPDNKGIIPLDVVIRNDDIESLKFLLEVDEYIDIPKCYQILQMKSMQYFSDSNVLWIWDLLVMLFIISPTECAKEQCKAFTKNDYLDKYYRMYSIEIKNLKMYFVGDKVSLYDFLNMNIRRRSRYIQNIDLKACARKFPRYHELIKYKCHEAIERHLLIESAKLALYKVANHYLPDICVDYILDFLRNIHLQTLVQCVR